MREEGGGGEILAMTKILCRQRKGFIVGVLLSHMLGDGGFGGEEERERERECAQIHEVLPLWDGKCITLGFHTIQITTT